MGETNTTTETVTETTVESPAIPDRKEEHRLPSADETKVVEHTETTELTHSGGELQELRVVDEG